jgi:hypothetical protein
MAAGLHADHIAAKFGLGEFDEILPDDGDTVNWEEYDDQDPIAQARMALLTHLDDKAAGEAVLPYDLDISAILDQVSTVFHQKHVQDEHFRSAKFHYQMWHHAWKRLNKKVSHMNRCGGTCTKCQGQYYFDISVGFANLFANLLKLTKLDRHYSPACARNVFQRP